MTDKDCGGTESAAASVDRKTWIRLCAQELMILRTGMSASESEAQATRIWGGSSHLGPMTAAALLDRMLPKGQPDE